VRRPYILSDAIVRVLLEVGCTTEGFPVDSSEACESRIIHLFDPREGIYMSELAVLMEERQKGLGEALIQARFRWAKERGFRFYLLRTAASGSNSQRLYERLGAKRTTFTQDVSLDGIVTSSTQRIFLWGEIP
jgi:ribosomal protein S18 acetylase RimI-like enzyme